MKACVLVAAVGLLGCWNPGGTKGSGNTKAEVRQVARFASLDVSGALDVDVAVAAEPRVEVTGDDNLVPLIETQVTGERLVITNRHSIHPVVPLIVHVAAPRLAAVTVSGASSVALHGMHGDQLALTVHGASRLTGDGAVQQLTVEAAGASKLDIAQLTAERARVSVAGSSKIDLTATRALDAEVSGASAVTYGGNPAELKQDVSGASSLVKR